MDISWESVGKLLGTAAPMVGTALGGPAGAAVGSLVAGLLGVNDSPDAVAAAIKADPSLAVKIEELKLEAHRLDLEAVQKAKQAEIDILTANLQDVQNARAMQVAALTQEDKFSKRFVYYLATFWSVTAFLYIFCITFGTIPKDNIRFADTILGFLLGTIVATVINYFYGSSQSSSDKSKKLNEIADQTMPLIESPKV